MRIQAGLSDTMPKDTVNRAITTAKCATDGLLFPEKSPPSSCPCS